MNVQDNTPTAKVTMAGLAGVAVIAVVYVLNTFVPFFKDNPIDATLSAMLTTLATGVAGYFTPPSRGDVAEVK